MQAYSAYLWRRHSVPPDKAWGRQGTAWWWQEGRLGLEWSIVGALNIACRPGRWRLTRIPRDRSHGARTGSAASGRSAHASSRWPSRARSSHWKLPSRNRRRRSLIDLHVHVSGLTRTRYSYIRTSFLSRLKKIHSHYIRLIFAM